MRAAEDEEIRKHFHFVDIADFCLYCTNYEPKIFGRDLNDDCTVTNRLYCANQNTCLWVQKELEEL